MSHGPGTALSPSAEMAESGPASVRQPEQGEPLFTFSLATGADLFMLWEGSFLCGLKVPLGIGGMEVEMSWRQVLDPCTGQQREEEQVQDRCGFCASWTRHGCCLPVSSWACCRRS